MKKAKTEPNDWLRPEYTRADLGPIVRGKYARRMATESNVVVIDPAVSKAFPNENPSTLRCVACWIWPTQAPVQRVQNGCAPVNFDG